MTPKAQATKEERDKLDINKMKTCVSKNTMEKVKGKTTEWEKRFASHISHEELASRLYKELLQLKKATV